MMNKHFLLFVNIWVWGLVLSGCTTVKYPDDKLYAEYAKAIRRGDLEYVIDFVKQYKKYALNDIYILGQHYNPLDVAVVSDSNEIVEFLLAKGGMIKNPTGRAVDRVYWTGRPGQLG
ncbi:MAG: hypothetical protein WHT84_12250, partial [Breznakiellaceae bacterium]